MEQAQAEDMFAEDSDDSEWQQDWESDHGAQDERDDQAMVVDLTQEDEVGLLSSRDCGTFCIPKQHVVGLLPVSPQQELFALHIYSMNFLAKHAFCTTISGIHPWSEQSHGSTPITSCFGTFPHAASVLLRWR